MATLNVTVIEGRGMGPQILDEALSVLRWAAEAGPFSLSLEFASEQPDNDFESSLRRGDMDAVLLDSQARASRGAMLETLHEATGVFGHLRSVKADPAWLYASPLQPKIASAVDLLMLDAMPPASGDPSVDAWTLDAIDRVTKSAAEFARRRSGRITRLRSFPASPLESLWSRALHEAAAEYDVDVDHCPAESFTARLLADPSRFDIVVAEDRIGAFVADQVTALTGFPQSSPDVWLGRRANIYRPRIQAGESTDLDTNMCAAMHSIAMLLEHSAARFGLAETLRSTLTRVFTESSPPMAKAGKEGRSAWHVGQAVIERLEEGFPLRASY